MASEMVEKVRKALSDTVLEFYQEPLGQNATRADLDNLAVAAIKAMREPTMPMLNAAVDRTGAGGDMSWVNRSPQGLFEAGHQAMIDAALAGEG